MTKSIDLGARVIAGVNVSDSPLITEAIDYARTLYDPYLLNHAMRSWLFAAKIGQSKGIDVTSRSSQSAPSSTTLASRPPSPARIASRSTALPPLDRSSRNEASRIAAPN